MAVRTDLPRIPTNEQPTIWNLGAALGLLKGTLWGAGAIVATSLFASAGGPILAASVFAAATSLFGAFKGGVAEREEMKNALEHGKVVKEPTFWNKEIVKGLGQASLISVAVTVASLGMMAAFGIGGVEILSAGGELSAQAVSALAPIALLSSAASLIVPIKAGFDGKKEMQRELAQAETLQQQQHLAKHRSHEHLHAQGHGHGHAYQQQHHHEHGVMGQSYKNSVTPEEYALLQARMAAGKEGAAGQGVGQHAAKAAAAHQPSAQQDTVPAAQGAQTA